MSTATPGDSREVPERLKTVQVKPEVTRTRHLKQDMSLFCAVRVALKGSVRQVRRVASTREEEESAEWTDMRHVANVARDSNIKLKKCVCRAWLSVRARMRVPTCVFASAWVRASGRVVQCRLSQRRPFSFRNSMSHFRRHHTPNTRGR